jgi:hypothetical protein
MPSAEGPSWSPKTPCCDSKSGWLSAEICLSSIVVEESAIPASRNICIPAFWMPNIVGAVLDGPC